MLGLILLNTDNYIMFILDLKLNLMNKFMTAMFVGIRSEEVAHNAHYLTISLA